MDQLETILKQNGLNVTTDILFDRGENERGYHFAVRGEVALETWHKLRALVDQTGYWPVILGDAYDLGKMLENLEENSSETTSEIINAALELNAAQWLQTRFEDLPNWRIPRWKNNWAEIIGEWPVEITPLEDKITNFRMVNNLVDSNCSIGLIPTIHSWQLPGFLRLGGWSYCPEPPEHCSVIKHWSEQYGAEIVEMRHDAIELLIAQPLNSLDDAYNLAERQYGYCTDIVEQGIGTIRGLATDLLNELTWYFWWD